MHLVCVNSCWILILLVIPLLIPRGQEDDRVNGLGYMYTEGREPGWDSDRHVGDDVEPHRGGGWVL